MDGFEGFRQGKTLARSEADGSFENCEKVGWLGALGIVWNLIEEQASIG
jgi:hypothetical protein